MVGASNRIARMMEPHVRLSDGLRAAIERSVANGDDCPIDRCMRTLQLLGKMGFLLRNDPDLLTSLLANDSAVRPHPAIDDLARWLGDGASNALRLRIPPVVVSVVSAPFPAVFEVVEFRKAIPGTSATVPEPVEHDEEVEILRLYLEVVHTAEAAARVARITDPDRRCILHSLVVNICLAVVRVGTLAENASVEPGLQRDLASTIGKALRGPSPMPTMIVSAHGLEVGFRLGIDPEGGLPFRIVRVSGGSS
jgi:hypothetical protein